MKILTTKKNRIVTLESNVFHPRFQHISEQIFSQMDTNRLKNCRQVYKLCQNCIEDQNRLWNKIPEKIGKVHSFSDSGILMISGSNGCALYDRVFGKNDFKRISLIVGNF